MLELIQTNSIETNLSNTQDVLLGQRENVLSQRYKLLTTQDVLQDFIQRQGFFISSIQYGKRRGKKDLGQVENTHGEHIVRLRHEALKIGNDYIEVVISNSYNGTTPFSISLGIYRLVCSNGLILGDNFYSAASKHVGSNFYEDVNEYIQKALTKTQDVVGAVEALKSRQLTKTEILDFADNVYRQRLKDVKGLDSIDLERSIRPLRIEDDKKDAFTILNILQEYSLRGGIEYTTKTPVKDDNNNVIDFSLKKSTTKSIYQPKRTIELNKYIFDAAAQLVA